MHKDIERVLFSHEQLVKECERIGKKISQDYKDKEPIIVGLLNGAVPFVAELIKHIDLPVELEFIQVKSYYGGTKSTGAVNIVSNVNNKFQGRDVIICDDILDTGTTLVHIKNMIMMQGAKSVAIAALLNKVEAHKDLNLKIDYVGLDVENLFVVGFGLDYNEKYRNLPYIGVLKETVYSK